MHKLRVAPKQHVLERVPEGPLQLVQIGRDGGKQPALREPGGFVIQNHTRTATGPASRPAGSEAAWPCTAARIS